MCRRSPPLMSVRKTCSLSSRWPLVKVEFPAVWGAESAAGVEDYNFTDDFDTGEAEYGVDENVLDLSDAEAEGYEASDTTAPMSVDEFEFDSSGIDDIPASEEGSDDFNLDIDETQRMIP